MSVLDNIAVRRLAPREVESRLNPAHNTDGNDVWHFCRHCGADIPPSKPNHAYCNERCKRARMAEEMW